MQAVQTRKMINWEESRNRLRHLGSLNSIDNHAAVANETPQNYGAYTPNQARKSFLRNDSIASCFAKHATPAAARAHPQSKGPSTQPGAAIPTRSVHEAIRRQDTHSFFQMPQPAQQRVKPADPRHSLERDGREQAPSAHHTNSTVSVTGPAFRAESGERPLFNTISDMCD